MSEIKNIGRTPWSFDAWGDIRDAENVCVARANGNLSDKDARRVTETIVEAVNEQEKMAEMVREMLPVLSWGISVCQWYRELAAIADKAGLLRLAEVKSLLADEQTIRTLLDKARRAVGKEASDGQE